MPVIGGTDDDGVYILVEQQLLVIVISFYPIIGLAALF